MQPEQPPIMPSPPEIETTAPTDDSTSHLQPNHLPAQAAGLPNLQMPDQNLSAELNLSQGEGLYCQIARHPIGIIQFYVSSGIGIFILLVMLYLFITHHESSGLSSVPTSIGIIVVFGLAILLGMVNSIAVNIYKKNRMFLTNESLILEKQNGLFNSNRKTLSLETIEDISYTQSGPMQQMLNYGTLKIATIGEDGITFPLAQNPKRYSDYITNAREQFMRENHHNR